jgi:PleD family two-component response regulator
MTLEEVKKDPVFANKKIMIVDDSKMMLLLYSQVFEKAGADIILCSNGKDALDLAIKHQPNCIVVDFLLPDINGDEVCQMIKGHEETSHIPVVMLTGHEDEKYIISAIESGADDYLFKRSVPKVITTKIKLVLEKVELKKQVEELRSLVGPKENKEMEKLLEKIDKVVIDMIMILSGRKTNFKEYLDSLDGEGVRDF